MVMTPHPDDFADDPPKARFYKNMRVLDIGWMVLFNQAMTVKDYNYQLGAFVIYGAYW